MSTREHPPNGATNGPGHPLNTLVNALAHAWWRVGALRRLPRQRLVPRLVWAWLRWRWPQRRAAVELHEHADGTVEMVRRPLRVWWPWSWILATEQWLASPVVCSLALALARAVAPGWPWLVLGAAVVALRSWWVCQDHRAMVGPVRVPTLAVALAALALALAWLAWSGSGAVLALALGATSMARLWHSRHGRAVRIRRVARTWAVRLGMDGARLAGSVIEGVTWGAGGSMALRVVLPPGRLSLADLDRSRGHIATAYGTSRGQVRVERGDDDSRPVVHIAPPGALARVAAWPGDAAGSDGVVTVGVLADDQPATVRLWSAVGSKIVWLVGKRGSGKSRAVHLLLSACARSGLVILDLVDMKGGVDLSRWAPHTITGEVACDLEGAREALRRANRVHDLRMLTLRESGAEKWVVGTHGPLWLTVLEEAPEALSDPECASLAGRLARLSRASGVGLLIVSQIAKIEAVGGREVAQNIDLRVIFECDRDTARRAVDGQSEVDMSAVPPGRPGVALWLGEGTDSGQLGRWYDVDPTTVTEGALEPDLDVSARAVAGRTGRGSGPNRRRLVAAYVAEHPQASSTQVEQATGVPAGTVRRWKSEEE
jgi:hypothetical protein